MSPGEEEGGQRMDMREHNLSEVKPTGEAGLVFL